MRFLILLAAIALTGCEVNRGGLVKTEEDRPIIVLRLSVDGCQYLVIGGTALHKSNCNNPFHWKDTPAVTLLPEIEIVPPEMEVEAKHPTRPIL